MIGWARIGGEDALRGAAFADGRGVVLAASASTAEARLSAFDSPPQLVAIWVAYGLSSPQSGAGPHVGASIGAMTTRTMTLDEELDVATYHVPFAIGLSLGEHHEWDVAFSYLIHPSEDQYAGAIAIGFSFQVAGRPLDR